VYIDFYSILYGQPKVHKKEVAYRIIISGRDHSTFKLAKWLEKKEYIKKFYIQLPTD